MTDSVKKKAERTETGVAEALQILSGISEAMTLEYTDSGDLGGGTLELVRHAVDLLSAQADLMTLRAALEDGIRAIDGELSRTLSTSVVASVVALAHAGQIIKAEVIEAIERV